MNIRLRDRLGLVVGVVLYAHNADNGFITYMQRDKNGVLWAHTDVKKNNKNIIVLLNKNSTCSATKFSTSRPCIVSQCSGNDSFVSYIRWKLLRDHIADEKQKKKDEKKNRKSSIVKHKDMKHIIANWVADDL